MPSKLKKIFFLTFAASHLLTSLALHAVTPSAEEILAKSTPKDWRIPDQDNLLYMKLPQGMVIFELAPEFAPEHVSNIKLLAKEKYWDKLSVYRVHDNFVAQFGDPMAMESREGPNVKPLGSAREKLPAEFERSSIDVEFSKLPDVDGWAPQVGFSKGFAVGKDPKNNTMWLTHCYGMLGAGRFSAKDSSTGAELYMVIGQSPRQIDLNITSVGRVIQGAEFLSGLKRGTGVVGIYKTPEEYTPIEWIRLGTDLKAEQQVNVEILHTNSEIFKEIVEAKRNRVDDFYARPAGHIDLCNISVPVREQQAHLK
ncbi:peptidylprolyl isomerase [Thorsellia kenyensis]|uniref:peptidylprolyl isomerase n=1 Tax=Thorsellia kenyensis TaxID=1549888 RepID=A0ABV6CAV7_9GAMM